MGSQMKVSEYATNVINTRPYKYETRLTYFKDLKRLGIWNMDVTEVNSALIRNKVELITTQSTRKRLFITARSIFRDLDICQDLPNLEAEGKIYDIPTQEELEWLIERSKYRLQLLLCMFGGLRVGEACEMRCMQLILCHYRTGIAYSPVDQLLLCLLSKGTCCSQQFRSANPWAMHVCALAPQASNFFAKCKNHYGPHSPFEAKPLHLE